MRMKKATAFGLAALMAATMIPAVPAMAKGDDSEGSVYYLNFKPEQADQWSDLAKYILQENRSTNLSGQTPTEKEAKTVIITTSYT